MKHSTIYPLLTACALAATCSAPLSAQVAATPLVETYVGQWCPNSPRGLIGMDRMSALHPDTFVGLLYHIPSRNGQRPPLLTVSPNPGNVANSPVCIINRSEVVDPWWGNAGEELGVERDWQKHLTTEVPAKMSVQLMQTSPDALTATVNVGFVGDPESSLYRVAFVLVGDSISTEAFDSRSNYVAGQRNSYNGDPFYQNRGDDWDRYVNGTTTIYGVKYNNVVLQYDTPFEGRTLAINPERGVAYGTTRTFFLNDVTNYYGDKIPVPDNRYRVVAILIDGRGNVINCAKSSYPQQTTSLTAPTAPKEIQTILYHDLFGRPLTTPVPGTLHLETTIFTDGSRQVRKLP